MTDREIMQQALDALLHMCNTTKAQNDYNAKIVDKALVALETALAQPEQECDLHECRRKVQEADDDSSRAGGIIYRR